jgi:hypothetical protein
MQQFRKLAFSAVRAWSSAVLLLAREIIQRRKQANGKLMMTIE